ncbi:zinc-binding dehydrogenase [Achromobacter sp. GG226]|uniref:MDR/zinc-dependent alcohol dehydrogenase-like family protein n=1 Tax=Verticiella alkaliphila TaxID=2779529 RepID=UPI001C0E8531|nr:medium chain dehydrogenase/reductase family protein [Verticiella sp. GG226]MBU4612460.1 zinc-binding dehydrogenase [Verticiella sp. GG226]
MKAWYKETLDSPLACVELPDPTLRPGSIVVDVLAVHVPAYLAAMVDSTEIPLPVPLVIGAGGVGKVSEVAGDVHSVKCGDLVSLDCLLENGNADSPEDVLMGLGEIGGKGAETETVKAIRDGWRDGTMAQRVVIPATAVTRLPKGERYADSSEPVAKLGFLTWLAIAAEGVVQSDQRPGDVVAVLGATGQMGGAAVLVALARGASRVIAAGRNEPALQRLADLDERVSIVVLSGNVEENTKRISSIASPHVVIDAVGGSDNPDVILAGFGAMRDSGTMVLMSGTRCDVPLPYGEVLRRRLTIKGSRMYKSQTMAEVWRMVSSGLINLANVDVHVVGIDDPRAAIAAAAQLTGLSFVSLTP